MVGDAKRRLQVALPGPVGAVVQRLERAGGAVWLVGGAVRDGLLGHPVRDWDLATTADPAGFGALFPEARELDPRLGACHLEIDGIAVVVTGLREEDDYRDHRHPSEVRFVDTPARDARRRDFTVNALYADPRSGAVIDPCGGLPDLDARCLRTIGAPRRRFAEDPLRLLRALRFAARLGFDLHPETATALARCSPMLHQLSAERVFAELTAAFTGPGRGRALRLLVDHGAATQVLPEVAAMAGVPQPPQFHPEGDVLTHVCLVLEHGPAGDPVQAWSAVLHDIGKPATFGRAADRIRFHEHDVVSAEMARTVLRRLGAPRELREVVEEVCRDHIRFASLPQMTQGKRERWLRSPRFRAHLAFHRADCLGSHGDLSIHETARRWLRELPPEPPPPLCSGRDVVALGVAEGPVIGEILRAVQARLDGLADPDRDTALAVLREIATPHVKGPGSTGR